MTSRVSSKNKEKKAKRKNSVLKKRPLTEKQNGTKKQKQRRRDRSRTRFIYTFKHLLDHCTTVTHMT